MEPIALLCIFFIVNLAYDSVLRDSGDPYFPFSLDQHECVLYDARVDNTNNLTRYIPRERWPVLSTLLGILSLLYKILSWWFLWVSFAETHAQCFFTWLDSFRLMAQTHPRCYTVFAEPAAAVALEQWCHLHRASHSPQVAACVCFCEFWEAPALPHYSDFCRAWRGWRNGARLTNNPEEWPPRCQIKLYLSKTRGEMWVYLLCVLTLGLFWPILGLELKFGRSSKKVIDTLRLDFFFFH